METHEADTCPACGRGHYGAGLCTDCELEDTIGTDEETD